jgi:WD40 repeat protein
MAEAGKPPEWSEQAALMVAFSPDGKTLASGGPGGPPSLRIWDLTSGKKITEVAGAISIRYLSFSPDGRTLATGHGGGAQRGDGSLQLWDTTTWKEKLALVGHTRLCKYLAWQRDGRTLVSASIDGTVKVWHPVESVDPVPSAAKGRTSK